VPVGPRDATGLGLIGPERVVRVHADDARIGVIGEVEGAAGVSEAEARVVAVLVAARGDQIGGIDPLALLVGDARLVALNFGGDDVTVSSSL
jgi:hypothetical protein